MVQTAKPDMFYEPEKEWQVWTRGDISNINRQCSVKLYAEILTGYEDEPSHYMHMHKSEQDLIQTNSEMHNRDEKRSKSVS